tara:strand:+ start:2647 stop:2862 length:216 start_codon:yes stop_codon:yes gene_type:complete
LNHPQKLVSRVFELAESNGLSQADLSKLTGLSESTISETAKQKTLPTLKTFLKLAKAVNMKIGEDDEKYLL